MKTSLFSPKWALSRPHPLPADGSRAALSTSRFIHRKILIRLFLGWLFLSVVIGGVVLWLLVNRIQQFVHELALRESATFSGESAHNLERLDSAAQQHLAELAQQLVNQHFLVVELHDRNKQLRLEAIRRGQEVAEHGITFTTLLMYPIVLMLNRGLIKLSGDLQKGNLELMNVLGCAIAAVTIEFIPKLADQVKP